LQRSAESAGTLSVVDSDGDPGGGGVAADPSEGSAAAAGVGEHTVKEKMVGVAARNCAGGRADPHVGVRAAESGATY
jgi:hypothetical protein